MASIFLSYAREDAAKAKALARCLERAGHSVWWDRHIHGGSEYAGEIEAALRSADLVLVLWSETSIRSAWVRDEAAEGRDSGRLVPIILDDSTPPLGFRQLQSIPISGWSGRGNPPNWHEILDAITARCGARAKPADQPTTIASTRRPIIVGLVALGALLLAVGAWWLLEGRGKAAEPPVLAVLPFSDLSQERDKAYFAEGVAEAILSLLAKEAGIRVVGRSTARQLHDAGPRAGKMRRELGITHILEGSARSVGDQLRMSVRLIDASDGQQLWAEEYQRRLDNIFAVQDEIGRAVAQRLKGSFGQSPAAQQLTSADAYTLYLAARSKMRDRRMSSLQDALKMARQVIAADPNYAPGHAVYAELIWHMSAEAYGRLSEEDVWRLGGGHARRAIQLAPNSSEGYAALGLLSSGEEAIRAFLRAVELDPSRSELRLWLARAYATVGNNEAGLAQLEAGVAMDPLFGPGMWNYVGWLAASDRYDEAERAIQHYEQRGGSAAIAARVRGEVTGYYGGDHGKGIRLAHEALGLDPEVPLGRASLAWGYDLIGLHRQAAEYSDVLPTYTRLKFSGDVDRLLAQVKSDGADVWKRADVDLPLRALAEKRDWAALERSFDNNPQRGSLCNTTGWWGMQMLVDLATGLKLRGREGEASALLGCVKRHLTAHGRGPTRSGVMPGHQVDVLWAQIHALEGRPQRAFPLLDSAIRRGARTHYGAGLSEYPVFDPYQSLPQYRVADARLKQLIAQDRAEVLRMLAARPPQRRAA